MIVEVALLQERIIICTAFKGRNVKGVEAPKSQSGGNHVTASSEVVLGHLGPLLRLGGQGNLKQGQTADGRDLCLRTHVLWMQWTRICAIPTYSSSPFEPFIIIIFYSMTLLQSRTERSPAELVPGW